MPVPHYARVFKFNNSDVVRLPEEFHLDAGHVEVTREGDAVVLRPRPDRGQRWASLNAALERGFSDDFTVEEQPTDDDLTRR